MKRPAEPLTGNIRGSGLDSSDWDATTALAVYLTGGRAERRAAKRWLQRQQQCATADSKKTGKK